jgi:hypothetical protein
MDNLKSFLDTSYSEALTEVFREGGAVYVPAGDTYVPSINPEVIKGDVFSVFGSSTLGPFC